MKPPSEPLLDWHIRPAQPSDAGPICRMIAELAEFEHLTHLMEVTPEALASHLFGATPAAEALVAVDRTRDILIGYALFFPTFSTFLGRPGLWLEDLYISPEYRARGIGRALLTAYIKLAQERGCGRCEWSVLDWNETAIALYRASGAEILSDWRIVRMDSEGMGRYLEGKS